MRTTLSGAALTLLLLICSPALAEDANFPVSAQSAAGQSLVVDGKLEASLGTSEIATTIFALDDKVHHARGLLMRNLMKQFSVTGGSAKITALDGYSMEIPVEDFIKYDVVLATSVDGAALTVRDRGPAWIIYPVSNHPELKDPLYEARSVWQIKTIEFK